MPLLASAAEGEPGGVLFRPVGGKNRADALDGSYRCLYASSAPDGAIAEAFGRFDFWDKALFAADPASPMLPGSRFALVTYEMANADKIRDLDDANVLLEEDLRPSQVVTRNRQVTQGWATRIHSKNRYAGVRWWSYYDSGWYSIALWDLTGLNLVEEPRLLTVTDDSVQRAAATIVRRTLN